MRYLFACLVLLASFGFLSATTPRQRVIVPQTFLATQFQPLVPGYTIPTYGAAYTPAATDETIKALTDAINRLSANLERSGGIVGPAWDARRARHCF